MLVTDLPVWDDCPFRQHVPESVTIRRGRNPEYPDEMLAFEVNNGQRHVDVQMTWPEKYNRGLAIIDEILVPVLNNLGMKPIL